MICEKITYSEHAFTQMFKRKISFDEVEEVLKTGETIEEYPDDKPFPSKLLLAFLAKRPLHVVSAFEEKEKNCIIVTAYEPEAELWTNNFKTRIK